MSHEINKHKKLKKDGMVVYKRVISTYGSFTSMTFLLKEKKR